MSNLPEYNGWTNYPTFAVFTWIQNDETAQDAAATIAAAGALPYDIGSALQDWIATELLYDRAGLDNDLLDFALQYVNWREIAAALLED